MLKKNFTILIVEDNYAMRRLLESMVSGLGYTNILSAENGAAAWTVIEEEEINVILCDLAMPVMNGLELLNKLRSSKQFYNVPFIMITGTDNQSKIMHTLQAEVDHYMIKPPTVDKLDKLLKLVTQQKENPSKYYQAVSAGKYFYLNKNMPKALQFFEAAARFQPDSPVPFFYMGKIFKKNRKDDLAITNFNKCISLSGLYINALFELADIYSRRKDDKLIISVLQRVIQLLPDDADVQRNLGVAYGHLNNKEKAALHLQNAVKFKRGDKIFLAKIVEDFISAGLYDEADYLFLNQYEEEDKAPIASFWNRLGTCLRKEGAFNKARHFYISALKYFPQDKQTNLNLAHLLTSEKNFDAALSYVNKVLRLFSDCKEAKKLKEEIQLALRE